MNDASSDPGIPGRPGDVVAAAAPREVGALVFRPLEIDTWQEHVIYMHPDCPVCRAEGFSAQARVRVQIGDRSLIATLTLLGAPLLNTGEASLSLSAARTLSARAGDVVHVTHAPALESVRALRAKIYGCHLDSVQLDGIIGDISAGRYADVHIAAFLTACADGRMSLRETVDLTRAMVRSGQRLNWDREVVADKHCVGGLPGNRTTPVVVAIAAAAGLLLPKTSSRAITSPAGTADTMEALTRVTLDSTELRRVVEQVGAALVWGGALSLSPADDVLIRVERALDIDSDAQLVASILSKKIAAGSTHVLIDVPVGPTAKIREDSDLARLDLAMTKVADAFGLKLRILRTDGSQPVGRGVGPALEALDVLAVLQCQPTAPADLRERSLLLAGELLEFCGAIPPGQGRLLAGSLLDSGAAWARFQAICEAQGGLRTPGQAVFRRDVVAARSGIVTSVDNRHVARTAKLAGAPRRQVAGLELHVRAGDEVVAGAPLCTLHAQASGELEYAFSYALAHDPFRIE
ncbi:Putative thymidine phosphorylase 1 [Cupriavidus necator]|uniref:Putative thymidine phosphorylase 1 n=1 Tax=Cupriavidus necator (strain ATCC 17699 / DSM 428 / KCTC 22496 / NCIMB 10442 / H16 / Stanier 337) TaxID=381666 RepID=TYPH1_CUPNH|nr:RecName: Full=Putative thymidine phosphorylase 1; AltName: Full=TdRPase 1 [Cupriavidus necator H16]CAJ93112.1 thymidine phosphorylase [Cupriavidus necator H16]